MTWRGRDGFTLLETLVAISILGIVLAIFIELFSGGLRASRTSDELTKAVVYGREKMEEILSAAHLVEGMDEGDIGEGFRWQSSISKLEPPEDEAQKTPFNIYKIQLKVSWGVEGRRKSYDLSTLKILPKPVNG